MPEKTSVGRLLAHIDEAELRENTIVIFLSDNGNSGIDPLPEGAERLPGRKGDSREGGTRVPFIVRWSGKVAPGSKCGNLVHVQDLLATLAELAGETVAKSNDYDGRSFVPQLLGKQGEPRQWFIGWGAHPSLWLDRVREELGRPNLEARRLIWVRGLRYKLYNDGRFYDLEKDLAEEHRILPGKGSAGAEAVRATFQKILDRYGVGSSH
jgi:arylsulfatase A